MVSRYIENEIGKRCGVAHLKGERYARLKKDLGIGERKLPEVFNDILPTLATLRGITYSIARRLAVYNWLHHHIHNLVLPFTCLYTIFGNLKVPDVTFVIKRGGVLIG